MIGHEDEDMSRQVLIDGFVWNESPFDRTQSVHPRLLLHGLHTDLFVCHHACLDEYARPGYHQYKNLSFRFIRSLAYRLGFQLLSLSFPFLSLFFKCLHGLTVPRRKRFMHARSLALTKPPFLSCSVCLSLVTTESRVFHKLSPYNQKGRVVLVSTHTQSVL